VVFRAAAAGTVSAKRGCYYAHPQNKFWRTLREVELTPRLLSPEEFPLLPSFRLGLTDIAKSVSGMDSQLPAGALGSGPRAASKQKIVDNRPAFLAFTSLNAGRRFLGRAAGLGEQAERIGDTRIWLLPSSSPAAHWNWKNTRRHWRELAEAARLTA
jgi:TDG/mug DNA glycosylase family protein